MLQSAAQLHNLDLARSWMVGDTISDMGAGKNAGCRTILVETGYGADVSNADDLIDDRVATLADAARLILTEGDRL